MPRDRRSDLLICATLFVAIFAAYAGVATHHFLSLEDPAYISQNPHVATGLTIDNVVWAFTTIYSAYWLPVTWISHMIDVQLFGLRAGAHLLDNVLLHAIVTVLLYFFLLRSTKRRWPSAVVAALFALHPLRVESVAWASSRKDPLSALFFLIALLSYLRYVETRSRRYGLVVCAAFVVGLAAKPMIVTLPFVLLLLDWWPLERPLRPNLLIEKIPLFAITVIFSILTVHSQQVAMSNLPLTTRFSNTALSYIAYLEKTIWPIRLAVIYPYRANVAPAAVAAAVGLLLAITAFAAIMGRRHRYVLVGWLWFVGTLVPASGLVQVGIQAMADRFTYIPSIGLFVAVVWLAADLVRNRVALAIASAVVILCATALTVRQVRYWRDSVTLFSHAIAAVDNNGPAHTLLGIALTQTQREAAVREFREALRITPADDIARARLAMTLSALGDPAAALEQATLAVKINPRNPDALQALGVLKMRAGQKEEAAALLQKSLDMKYDLLTDAEAAEAAGRTDEAIAKYRNALRFRQEDPDLHNNLAALLAERDQNEEAAREYRAALKIDPQFYDARMNLGAVLSRMGNDAAAEKEFQDVARLRPKNSEPLVYLALVETQTGRFRDAAAHIDAAMAMDPAAANEQLTKAIRIPFKESNIADYRAFLQRKAQGQ